MRVRGRRRCAECDRRWSYFETGSAACPACGSVRSVSVDEAASLHTNGPAALDLAPARSALDGGSIQAAARRASASSRDYLTARGFLHGGELLDLDDAYLAAAELAHASDHLRRALSTDERTEAYFLSLLAGADAGDRPDAVPDGIRWARGLAAADAVGAYRRAVARWLGEHPCPEDQSHLRSHLDRLRTHERRVAALDGDVPPRESEALVAAARGIGQYLRDGGDDALDRAADALEELG